MKLSLRAFLLVGLLALFSVAANAGLAFITGPAPLAPSYPYGTVTIGFDDLPGSFSPVPNGYYNLGWNNFYYLDGVNYSGNPSGYQNGVVSPNNVAYNAFGNPASIYSAHVDPFYVLSGFVTAAWRDNLEINITGYYGGNPVISGDFFINTDGPTYFYATGIAWIDDLVFTTSGGVNHGYNGDGTHVALDDLTVHTTPEPATMLLLGTGILGLVRKLRK
jgi:PEP-CTERM motif